jgi:hypothetical protein
VARVEKTREQSVTECIDAIRAGRETLDACIAAHPALADELRELTSVAISISPAPAVEPDPLFRARSRAELITALNATKQHSNGRWHLGALEIPRWLSHPAMSGARLGLPVAAALTLAIAAGASGGTVFAAQGTVPGDTLYPVKIAAEQVQVSLATSDQARAETFLGLADRRLSEVQKALDEGRPDAVIAASDALGHSVAQSSAYLTSAAATGSDVSSLAERLANNLNTVQTTLATAETRAPADARPALDRASQEALKGLTTASHLTSNPATIRQATPVPTATDTPVPTPTSSATIVPSPTAVPPTVAPSPTIQPVVLPPAVTATFTPPGRSDDRPDRATPENERPGDRHDATPGPSAGPGGQNDDRHSTPTVRNEDDGKSNGRPTAESNKEQGNSVQPSGNSGAKPGSEGNRPPVATPISHGGGSGGSDNDRPRSNGVQPAATSAPPSRGGSDSSSNGRDGQRGGSSSSNSSGGRRGQ